MKTVLTLVIGLCASLQLMAGGACCPMKAQKTAGDDKAKIQLASTEKSMATEAMDKKMSKSCDKMSKDCDKTAKNCEGKQCDTNMKKLGAAWQAMKADKQGKLDTNALKQIIAHGKDVVILDARTSQYDDGKRIPGAQIVGPAPTAEEIAKLIPSKDSYVVTYCGGIKCPLGGKLAAKLKGMGYQHVVEYPEGISGWAASGNEVATVAAN